CLLVMFGLVIALVLSVRYLDSASTTQFDESHSSHEASRLLLDLANALERADADVSASDDSLSVLRDDLAGLSDGLGADFEAEKLELDHLLGRVAIAIDNEGSVLPDTVRVTETVNRLERLSDGFLVHADEDVLDIEATLGDWFQWMQIVALVASIVFAVVVSTAILPLSRSIERSLNKLQSWRDRAARETARRTLSVQVTDGLDVADDEAAAYAVLARAIETAAPGHAAELLLADSSKAHLRAVVEHPVNGAAGCGVASPWSCPAVRRGSTMVFDDSEAIRSCPHLASRAEPCSAVCSPLTFMGQPMGVLHAVGPVGEAPPRELVEDLTTVAGEASTRIGTLRAFAKAELQASTDVLTGLPNRRRTEERIREVAANADGGALVLIEIDGLQELNLRLGKSGGDRAVTAVAEALQLATRPDDFIGRWTGSEFVAVLFDRTAAEASTIGRRFCEDATAALAAAELDGVSMLSGVADTRLADTVQDLLKVANDSLSFARRATVRRRSASSSASS
ncbi:MAG: diguanylate cyclase, partial [Actinomycetota bacterium]